jgi:hypothetical protein
MHLHTAVQAWELSSSYDLYVEGTAASTARHMMRMDNNIFLLTPELRNRELKDEGNQAEIQK